ncbi:hypothetical protein [Desulfosarcina ovata]|uniref:Uncharacterized protein n=2 Tax=Desulfosarcina ovata TaxID=83564 RepID=A0A5K8A510_9BACT|nr:hypothetical protein [Desulfosarcina ovata]BBO80065.1 hypothetical protein DSCO28_06310 [Desulfosarcina ovata subsp. sediminis]BBO87380.1 hypothetical protein DSCOOX_05600 [Desulfosarcina ovata subsp. ovata]
MLFSLDSSLLIAAGASFVAGVLGYIIARFWIKPIVRYNIAKRKLDHHLGVYLNMIDDLAQTPKKQAGIIQETLRTARKHGMDLVSCYSSDLPYWYRLLLESRQESPTEASGLLTNLSKMRDRQQIETRIAEARNKLNLKSDHGKKTT